MATQTKYLWVVSTYGNVLIPKISRIWSVQYCAACCVSAASTLRQLCVCAPSVLSNFYATIVLCLLHLRHCWIRAASGLCHFNASAEILLRNFFASLFASVRHTSSGKTWPEQIFFCRSRCRNKSLIVVPIFGFDPSEISSLDGFRRLLAKNTNK